MTVPFWRRSTSLERHDADAVVVGGGIVGLSAALELARRGMRVHLLERGTIGCGASTRNAGFLMRGCADHYADAARLYGRERARALWAFTEENLADLRREGVEGLPGYRATPSCLLALDAGQARELRGAHEMMVADGLGSAWIEPGDPGAGGDAVFASGVAAGGLVNAGDAAVQPAELIGMLAEKLGAAGAAIHEGAEVCSIAGDDRGVEVATGSMLVRASHAVLCTNAYGPALVPELSGLLTPRRGQMLAMEAESRRLDRAYYANHGSEYFRQADERTIVVGGCRTYFAEQEVGTEDATTASVQGALESFAARMLGGVVRVRARWAGIMAFTPDGLPIAGPIGPRLGPRVWMICACTGHGMSMGFRTARLGVAEMLGGERLGFGPERFGAIADRPLGS